MNACRIFSKALILLLAFPFFVHAQETQYVALAFGTVSQATVQSANFGYNYNYGTTYTLCSVNSPAPFTVEYVNDQVSYGGDFIAYILFNATTMGTYSGDIYLYYSSSSCPYSNISLRIHATGAYAVPGFINPKYVIVGVEYAPPGSSSTATYGNNTVVGNSSSVADSFSDQVTKSVAVSGGASLFGFSASRTSTSSNSYTQEQDSSSSIAVTQTTSHSTSLRGYSDPNAGTNHDYDYIFVWLNPIAQFAIGPNSNQVQWTGYGYDLNDTSAYPDMDVVGIQLGCLNGDFYQLYVSNPTANPQWLTCQDVLNRNFSRTWALNNADSSSPALTPTLANSAPPYDFCQQQGTDLYAICQVDPFANPGYTLTFPSGSYTTTDGRFTACHDSGCSTVIDYEPNLSTTYSQGYSTTVTQSQGTKYTHQVGYSVEDQFKTSGWLGSLSADLKNSTTFTWTHQFSQTTNSSLGQTASFNIVGPPQGYTGPTTFVVYQDNLYGTFMFWHQ